MKMMNKVVAIDVGHADGTGASGHGLEEHAVAAEVAELLKEYLEHDGIGADIIDFPDKSNSADLAASVRQINAGGYRLAVSLHCDCSDNPAAHGAHVCHISLMGYTVAAEIADRLCELMPGRAKKVVRRPELYFLRRTDCVAALVEMGFISNEEDAQKLQNCKRQIALKIAEGIKVYYHHILKAE